MKIVHKEKSKYMSNLHTRVKIVKIVQEVAKNVHELGIAVQELGLKIPSQNRHIFYSI